MNSSSKTVGLLLEHPFAIYDALPIVDDLRENYKICVLCPQAYILEAARYLELPNSCFEAVESVEAVISKRFTTWFELLFIHPNFSRDYMNRKSRRVSQTKLILKRMIAPIFSIAIRSPNQIYALLCTVLNLNSGIYSHSMRASVVVSFTKVYRPYLLAGIKGYHINIMESWDHPAKEPYLVWPDIHFTWNKDLKQITKAHQNLPRVEVSAPLKFRYLRDQDAQGFSNLTNYALYPMCTSSTYRGFLGELELLNLIAKKLYELGIHLLVRPYPLAPAADNGEICKIHNTSLSEFEAKAHNLEQLDLEYYHQKLSTIKGVAFVVNSGTTFAFDAALANVPVIQLQIKPNEFSGFGNYLDAAHIIEHLHSKFSVPWNEFMNLDTIGETLELAQACSAHLKAWVDPHNNIDR